MSISIHWFRQDLRLNDNPVLFEAAKSGSLWAIYILDDENAQQYQMGAASRLWLHHSLLALNKSLDGHLHLFNGNALEIIKKITTENPVSNVYWNRCYEPWRIDRDKKIKQYLNEKGIATQSYNGSLLREPWEIVKDDGCAYKIFTPFYKRAYLRYLDTDKLLGHPTNIKFASVKTKSDTLKSLNLQPDYPWGNSVIKHWNVGEKSAQNKLRIFLENGINNYQEGRNFPAKENVSYLSPHLHFGEISPRTIWHTARLSSIGKDLDTFLSEIGWREFSYYLLYHFPQLPHQNLQKKFDAFPWLEDKIKLEKWQKGMTGYPIVDAGMRQLWQTGYMHNRVRMIVGSFLVKNLRLHWHHGERWFWECLLDADLASNSASWQWVAGCGTDATPYFRVFNPTTQGLKFDPTGDYTKTYLPELKQMPLPFLFNPWEAPTATLAKAGVILGKTYPYPLIDLKRSREEALLAYQSIR